MCLHIAYIFNLGICVSQVRFTSGRLSKFECEPDSNQSFLWDSDAPGLGLRVSKTGNKAFIFQSRVGSSSFRLTIGDIKVWTIDSAQKEARRLQTLCDAGMDPRREKKKNLLEVATAKIQEDNQQLIVRTVWDKYVEAHKSIWGDHHLNDHFKVAHEGGVPHKYNNKKKTIPGPLAPILDVRLIDLTSEFLEKWILVENKTRPTQAALAFRLVRGFLNWCLDQNEFRVFVDPTAHKSRKVRRAVQPPQAKSGSLQKEQLKAWFGAVIALENKVASAYLQSIVLTGARREADAALKWSQIDFEWKSINMWDKVDKKNRPIPLTPYLESLLLSLPRVNEYVYSSLRSETGYIAEPRTAHNRCLEEAGLPHLTIHDLRRTFSNMCAWIALPHGVKNQIMGHKPTATDEKHYTNRPLDLLRMWHLQIEGWILDEAGVTFPL